MRRVRRCVGVGLPDVHLSAASAIAANGARLLLCPVLKIGLATDELQIVGALRIAVTGAVFGACFVVALTQAAIGLHLYKVDCTVQAAFQGGHVHIEGELTVQQLEHHVGVLVLHHVQSRANRLTVLKLQPDAVAHGAHAVRALILLRVHALQSASACAREAIRAEGFIPGRWRTFDAVLVLVLARVMQPTPLGVHGERLLLGSAAAGLCARRKADLRMGLWLLRADLLPGSHRKQAAQQKRGRGH
mmetsp:Transcript_81765/g.189927  ORF Transcript_81765/g.189927 Transcript_81765/m.189927 type:complete len:246 (-) Transcript_81765:2-739(-)